MNKPDSIKNYFKPKRRMPTIGNIMDGKKKNSLSLVKTPTPKKISRITDENKQQDVVCISSDDEDVSTPRPNNASHESIGSTEAVSVSSQNTVLYSVTPGTSSSGLSASPGSARSTPSRNKFYSPTKKRKVINRSPTKVKRNLNKQLSYGQHTNFEKDESFINACDGMDDKTIFLLTIVNKFLKQDSLRNLLDEKSITLLSNCMNVVKPGMRLVCRLYWYQNCWYKQEKLKEIINKKQHTNSIDDSVMEEIIHSLEVNGFIVAAKPSSLSSQVSNNIGSIEDMSFDELEKVLNQNEVKEICKALNRNTTTKKDGIEILRKFSKTKSITNYFNPSSTSDNSKRVLKMMAEKAGICYKLSNCARNTFYKLYLLMYLGIDYDIIRQQKLEYLLINNKINKETYPVEKDMVVDDASVVFETKIEFERYVDAHCLYENYLTKADTSEKCKIVTEVYSLYFSISKQEMESYMAFPPWLLRFTRAYIYIKILESGIQELKKEKIDQNYLLTIEILTTLINQTLIRQHKKADWYAEKALIVHTLGRYDEAATVLLDGFRSNISEEAKDNLRPRAQRIANQKNAAISEHLKKALLEYATKENILERSFKSNHLFSQPKEKSHGGKLKFEVPTLEGKVYFDAEDYCIEHYLKNGFTHGGHWEGRIITTIFHLLFWDIIYRKPRGIKGIFLTHFQLYPLDMYYESFYTNRKTPIDDLLEKIERSTEQELLEFMSTKWQERPEYELSGINRAIDWFNVRSVSQCLGPRAIAALCRRLALDYQYSSGFPDLTVWNINSRKIKFVEVKTDSDKPSMRQLQWMEYLRSNGLDVEFCYVGAQTTRCKARASQFMTA